MEPRVTATVWYSPPSSRPHCRKRKTAKITTKPRLTREMICFMKNAGDDVPAPVSFRLTGPDLVTRKRASLLRNLFHHAAQLAYSRDELQGEFRSLDAGRGPLVLRTDPFLQHYLWASRPDWRLDEMGSRFAGWDAPDHRATLSGVLLCQRRQRS